MGIKDSWSTMSSTKKGAIIGGGILAIVIIATAIITPTVICTNPYRKLDKTIEVWMPWQSDALNYTTFEEITDYYNENNDSDDWDINLNTIGTSAYKESGYTELPDLVKKDLQAGQKGVRKLPDIILSGQDVLSILSTFGDDNYTLSLDETGFDTTLLNNDVKQNNVAGVDTSIKTYAIPLLTTQSLGIDLPLLNWFSDQAGFTVSDEFIFDVSTDDEKTITKNWTFIGESSTAMSDFTFDSSLLENFSELEKFGKAIAENFENANDPGTYGIIGFTNPQTELMTMAQSLSDEDIISSTDSGNYYNFLHKDEEQYNSTGEVYSVFKDGIDNGAYWLPNGANTYSSGLISTHNLLITVGSTSGTTYNTSSDAGNLNSDEISYTADTLKFNDESKTIYKQQGPSMMLVDHKTKDQDERTEQIGKFLNFFASDEKLFEDNTLSSSQYFGYKAGYIAGTNSATNDIDVYGDSVGAKLILEQLDGDGEWMAEPADANTASFWSTAQANINAEGENKLSGKEFANWETYSSDLYDTVKTNNWESKLNSPKPKIEVITNRQG